VDWHLTSQQTKRFANQYDFMFFKKWEPILLSVLHVASLNPLKITLVDFKVSLLNGKFGPNERGVFI